MLVGTIKGVIFGGCRLDNSRGAPVTNTRRWPCNWAIRRHPRDKLANEIKKGKEKREGGREAEK